MRFGSFRIAGKFDGEGGGEWVGNIIEALVSKVECFGKSARGCFNDWD